MLKINISLNGCCPIKVMWQDACSRCFLDNPLDGTKSKTLIKKISARSLILVDSDQP